MATEDWTPLFDVTSVVRQAAPHATERDHVEHARAIVRVLLSRGHVKLFYDYHGQSSSTHRHVEELDQRAIDLELNEYSHWLYHEQHGIEGRWVTIGATSEGERALDIGEYSGRNGREE